MRKYQTHMTGRRLRDALPQPQEYACLLTPDGFLARVSPDLERDFGPAAQMTQFRETRARLFEQGVCGQSGGLIALRVRDRPELGHLRG